MNTGNNALKRTPRDLIIADDRPNTSIGSGYTENYIIHNFNLTRVNNFSFRFANWFLYDILISGGLRQRYISFKGFFKNTKKRFNCGLLNNLNYNSINAPKSDLKMFTELNLYNNGKKYGKFFNLYSYWQI